MSTAEKAAGRPGWPTVSRLAFAFVACWIPLLLLALATGWSDSGTANDGGSRLAEYALDGSAVSGPLSAQLILLVLAFGARRRGRLGLVFTGLFGLMGAAIAFNGAASGLADHEATPQVVAAIAGLGFFAFGTALIAAAAGRLLTPRSAAAAAGCVALCMAVTTGTASAKVYEATGKVKSDPTIEVAFELDAKTKKGVLSRAVSIGSFLTRNAPFECSATGYTGRAGEHGILETYAEPLAIAANGRFKKVYQRSARGHLIERNTLEGKVVGKGRFALVTGSFKSERSEGGLEFNNCATPKVAFTAKVRL